MKFILSLLLNILFSLFDFGQINYIPLTKLNPDSSKIQHVLDSLGIKLNSPVIPEGFNLYYNCDSMAFFKSSTGDKITILTPSALMPMEYGSENEYGTFSNYILHRTESSISIPTQFEEDGRIDITFYSPTIFIYRNDSLFIRESDDSEFIDKFFEIIHKYSIGEIDSATMEKRLKLSRAESNPIWMNCFIFHKEMFGASHTVNISTLLNPKNAKVTLEEKWQRENSNCYTILIEEDYQNMKTMIRYSFDDKLNFIKWEGCDP